MRLFKVSKNAPGVCQIPLLPLLFLQRFDFDRGVERLGPAPLTVFACNYHTY